jgi:hypothetical protein
MKAIQAALTPTDGYITSFIRNTVEGWWEIEVGLPASWVFDENSKIGCEVTMETDMGKLIKVFPKRNDVVIDDLVAFVEVVIDTNEKIAAKEKEFTDRIQKMKDVLEKEAIEFYEELDELKENSFKKNNADFDKKLNTPKTTKKSSSTSEKPKTTRKPRAPRTPRAKTTEKKVQTVTEKTEDIESKE